MPLSQILLMQRLDPGQVVLEQRRKGGGKGGEPVFVAFTRTDGQLLHLIVDVLDPESDRFHDAQPAPVEELGDHLGGSVHERENGGDFFACHDNGDGDLLVGAHGIDAALHGVVEGALVEEHQGIHGLVLGGGSDVSIHRQVGQERLDLGFGGEEVFAGPHAVETDESYDPLHIGSLGVNGVVVETEHLADVIEEFWLLTSRRVRHRRPPSWCPEIVDNGHWAKLPENPTNIALSGQNGKLING
jgi:hypothetical protein